MNQTRTLSLCLWTLLLCVSASAHQPIVASTHTLITDPEVSKAYYGRLQGSAAVFEIDSDTPFRLTPSLLVPDTPKARTDLWVTIRKDDQIISILNGSSTNWTRFYESAGAQWYLQGPQLGPTSPDGHPQGETVEAGHYSLRVESPDDRGYYVLAIGTEESFPPSTIARSIITLFKIQEDLGHSPLYAASTPFVLPFSLLLLISLSVTLWIARRYAVRG